jgi:hypothetical protein
MASASEIVDDSAHMLAIDFKNLGACKFATTQALFDLSGIVDGNK